MLQGKTKIAEFNQLLDRVNNQVASWKNKLLNKAGHLCLIKSTLTSIPVYIMQSHWISQAICDRINQACHRMLWAKPGASYYWSLVGWNTISKPLEMGGLGVREARHMNISLLGKLI
uniref:Ribonuclease H protein At1g65750 family n=1 Tax=Cajanus cajan TaxID=3821 RepID=A0A151TBE6_CAJCA|nr:Putative ribonuclease H protein At1g65750 family [Cajanus cajan]